MTTSRLLRAAGALLLAAALGACSSSSSGNGGASSGAASTATAGAGPASTSTAGTVSASASTASASATGTPSPSSTTSSGAVQVTIKNFLFEPADFTVRPGETVTVTNEDSAAHTLTAADKSFDTGTIAPGKSATFTAPTQPGSSPYICTIHPFMHGTLTVG
ncbi:cupredoxin domain-containing protein [Kitasatospora sp. NBC_00085]|uniref:cupredoxin domain-containing protein n=1 Tax=unclassified Kitasatospora TaxID=2633591 RepID=UPI00325377BA